MENMLRVHGYYEFCFIPTTKIRNIFGHVRIGDTPLEAKEVAKLNRQNIKNPLKTSTLLGALFLVVGLSLLVHSIYAVQDNEQMVASTDWTLEQMWHYDGSISWWSNASVTLFLPLTAVFLTISGVILVSQQLLAMLHHKSVL
jgi:hypothetical protein